MFRNPKGSACLLKDHLSPITVLDVPVLASKIFSLQH